MKKLILVFLANFLLQTANCFSQGTGFNTTGANANASAGVDIDFTNKGLLIPRIALSATNVATPVTSPATSLVIYNTATAGTSPTNVVPGYYFWNGAAWTYLITTSKVSVSIPTLQQLSTVNGRYYNPGYSVTKDNFSDYPSGPGTVSSNAAYEGGNNYVVSSNGNFSKLYGWVSASVSAKTVTAYAYLYTPSNNSSANITGTLIGSQVVPIVTAGANYLYEITASSPITKGQFIMIWFVPNANMDIHASGTIECMYIPQ